MYIPYALIFGSKMSGTKKELVIMFDENSVVKKISMSESDTEHKSGIFNNEKAVMAHERLAIVDPASAKQPMCSPNVQLVLAAKGEIYNHRE